MNKNFEIVVMPVDTQKCNASETLLLDEPARSTTDSDADAYPQPSLVL